MEYKLSYKIRFKVILIEIDGDCMDGVFAGKEKVRQYFILDCRPIYCNYNRTERLVLRIIIDDSYGGALLI